MENNQVEKWSPKEPPTLADLHSSPEVAFKMDKWNFLLSRSPNKKWVKKHPMITVKNAQGKNVPLEYLPVDKVKTLLIRIFGEYDWEISGVYTTFNAITVTGRLIYVHPATGKTCVKSGIGSVELQTEKGASAADLGSIKSMASMKAAGSAESYALKNAAEKIGNIFGASLGKYDTAPFQSYYEPKPGAEVVEKDEEGYEETTTQEEDLKTAEASGWHKTEKTAPPKQDPVDEGDEYVL